MVRWLQKLAQEIDRSNAPFAVFTGATGACQFSEKSGTPFEHDTVALNPEGFFASPRMHGQAAFSQACARGLVRAMSVNQKT